MVVAKRRNRRLHGLTAFQKFGLLFWAIAFSIFFFWVMLNSPDPMHPEFWIASTIEVGILWLIFKIPMRLHFYRFLVAMGAILIPTILAPNIDILKYIRLSPLVFGYFGAMYGLYNRATEKERFKSPAFVKKPNYRFPRLPSYLPKGFQEPVINQYMNKNFTVSEIVYNCEDSEHIFWINESNGPVPGFARRNWTEKKDRILKGINVTIANQLRKNFPPVVEIKWGDSTLNYVLRSDGLSEAEAERIVASMIDNSKN